MRLDAQADGCYSMDEAAPIVRVPESTQYRWRWQGKLLTVRDYLVDPDLAYRIAAASLTKAELGGAMPELRLNLEDCTRLRIVGYLRDAGWDTARLLTALSAPYSLPCETRGDGHSPVDATNVPHYLVLYAQTETKLSREVFDTREEAEQFARGLALAVIINLDAFRAAVQQELAQVDLARERRAAAREAATKAQTVADTAEKEAV